MLCFAEMLAARDFRLDADECEANLISGHSDYFSARGFGDALTVRASAYFINFTRASAALLQIPRRISRPA